MGNMNRIAEAKLVLRQHGPALRITPANDKAWAGRREKAMAYRVAADVMDAIAEGELMVAVGVIDEGGNAALIATDCDDADAAADARQILIECAQRNGLEVAQ